MTNLSNALEQLRAERGKAQAQVEKLEQAISVIESLNGSVGSRREGSQRIVSAAARRRMCGRSRRASSAATIGADAGIGARGG